VPLPNAVIRQKFGCITKAPVDPPTLKTALLLDIPCCLLHKLSTTEGTDKSGLRTQTLTVTDPFGASRVCLHPNFRLPDPDVKPHVDDQQQTAVSSTTDAIACAITWREINSHYEWWNNSCSFDAFGVTERAITEATATKNTCAETKHENIRELFDVFEKFVANPDKAARSSFWEKLNKWAPGHVNSMSKNPKTPSVFNSVFTIASATYTFLVGRVLTYETKVGGSECDCEFKENGPPISIPAIFKVPTGRTPTEKLLDVLSCAQQKHLKTPFDKCSREVAGKNKRNSICNLCQSQSCKEVLLMDPERSVRLPFVLAFEYGENSQQLIEPKINIAGRVYHLISVINLKSKHFTSTATHHTP
jgi:hypothetical protein